ncbi:single-stranded DNA-binding protein [Nocardia brasiliensis]|uniref:single-stranded DNA-binding protein n=1 Tax=Nocardia brasiliensis TaxID=37326 RepID=UPI0024556EC0|nr:single-stranded DNA-binding protein [Nocardia brasiliensis]
MATPLISSGTGFIIGDLDLRMMPNGQAVLNLPLAFSQSYKDEQSGDWKKANEIVVRGALFGPLAEWAADNIAPKTEVFVSGVVFEREWTDSGGATRKSVEMKIQSLGLAPRKGANGNTKSGRTPSGGSAASPWDSEDSGGI